MSCSAESANRVGAAGDRLARNVEDPVDVQQNRSHGRRVYSVTRSVVLPVGEIVFRFSRSSGPGGQHAQKSETRVEAVFDVKSSTALTEAQKRRVVARAGPVLRAVAQDERSQTRNRELAQERLVEQLRQALRVERRRVPTRPTEAARKRRLDQKRRRSQTKRLRRDLDD
jgi:ribosome-associated protein